MAESPSTTSEPGAEDRDLMEGAAPRLAVGVDVGGSGIKAAVVDVSTGALVSSRLRVPTPQPSEPGAVVPSIVRIVKRSIVDAHIDGTGLPIGVTMPSVVIDGVTKTAANIDPGWVDFDLAGHLTTPLPGPVVVLNDADAAGLAEMRFGAGRGSHGVVFVLTLGTGLGSGMFNDGILV